MISFDNESGLPPTPAKVATNHNTAQSSIAVGDLLGGFDPCNLPLPRSSSGSTSSQLDIFGDPIDSTPSVSASSLECESLKGKLQQIQERLETRDREIANHVQEQKNLNAKLQDLTNQLNVKQKDASKLENEVMKVRIGILLFNVTKKYGNDPGSSSF